MLRRLMCKLGFHSLFLQHDKWGSVSVCRYCIYVKGQ